MCLKTGHTNPWRSNFLFPLALLVVQQHHELRHASPQIWQKRYLRHLSSLSNMGKRLCCTLSRTTYQAFVDPLCLVQHMLHWCQAQCYPNSPFVICTESNFLFPLALLVVQQHHELRHASPQIWQKRYLRHLSSLSNMGKRLCCTLSRTTYQAFVDPLCLVQHMLHWCQAQCYQNSPFVICTEVLCHGNANTPMSLLSTFMISLPERACSSA